MIGAIQRRLQSAWLRWRYPQLKTAFAAITHLTLPERVLLYELARDCETVVEIGSYLGASALCLAQAMKERGSGKVVCVDTWQNEGMSEGNQDTYAQFLENVQSLRPFIHPVRGDSKQVADQVQTAVGQCDLLFIDGDHSYEGALADWRQYRPLLKPGAWVLLHDWSWAEGVRRVLDEEIRSQVDAQRVLPNLWGGRYAPTTGAQQ